MAGVHVAKVTSINISTKKGTFKQPVERAEIKVDHGIVGDAHAGNWHRQISLLAQESIDKMIALGLDSLVPGMFAENITTEGIELFTIPVGAVLRIGDCRVEVTQIGKECHQHCEVYKKVGQCIMPHEGIFVRVLTPGSIAVGDEIAVEA